MSNINNSQPDFSGSGPVEYSPTPEQSGNTLELLSAREEAQLFAIQGVTSVGIGIGPAGNKVLELGVVDNNVASRLPSDIRGIAVVVTVTGPVKALHQR